MLFWRAHAAHSSCATEFCDRPWHLSLSANQLVRVCGVQVSAHPSSQYKQQQFACRTRTQTNVAPLLPGRERRRRGGRRRRQPPHCVPFSVCQSVTVESVCCAHRITSTHSSCSLAPSQCIFEPSKRHRETVTFCLRIYPFFSRFADAILCFYFSLLFSIKLEWWWNRNHSN